MSAPSPDYARVAGRDAELPVEQIAPALSRTVRTPPPDNGFSSLRCVRTGDRPKGKSSRGAAQARRDKAEQAHTALGALRFSPTRLSSPKS